MTRIPVIHDDIELLVPDDEGIYVPAEDTFLLLDLVSAFLNQKVVPPTGVALDMGSGSGIVGFVLSKFFHEVHGIDVNNDAVYFQLDYRRKERTSHRFVPVNGSLLSFLRPGAATYDIACFNPPYLPPENGEDADRLDAGDRALVAGRGGVEVLESFLRELPAFLHPDAHVFYITSSLMDLPDHDAWLARLGYHQVEEKRVHVFFEDIVARHVIMRRAAAGR